jgi:two-component system, NarL family, response regulator DegU
MKQLINIAIAEDHDLLRQGLKTMLESEKNIKILFDVGNGKELLNKLKQYTPQIILY